MNLTELANRYGSDKGSVVSLPHRYTYLYELLFHPLRDLPLRLLEMGLAVGGPEVGLPADRQAHSPSVPMWLEYWPNAEIHGFDISDFSHQECDRFRFHRGDSGVQADLERLAAAVPGFDVIIDDASHASFHQQLALRTLWPKLTPGGLYIIEDLHWQSPYFEDALPAVPKTGTFMNAWFERGEYMENAVFSPAALTALAAEVGAYACFPSFSPGFGEVPKLLVLRKAG
jgi:hypothetical protein